MNLAETLDQKSLTLPPEKAREVFDFIGFIKDRPNLPEADGNIGAPEPKSLLEVFENTGLVGCLETDEQRSTPPTRRDRYDHADHQS